MSGKGSGGISPWRGPLGRVPRPLLFALFVWFPSQRSLGCVAAMPLIVTHVSLLVDQYGAGSRVRGAWPAPHNNTDTRACTTEKRRGGEEERGEGEYDTTITLHDRVHENKRYRKYNTTALRSYYTKPNHTMRPRKAASLQQMVTAAVQMTSRSR